MASYIKSQTLYTDAEYATLLANAKPGEDISRERVMFGQSPFLVNVGLGYRDAEKGFDAIVSYNVQGKRLVLLGIDRVPNVYEQPFNNLKVKIAQSFGEDDRFNFISSNLLNEVQYSNLLNDDRARAIYNARFFKVAMPMESSLCKHDMGTIIEPAERSNL